MKSFVFSTLALCVILSAGTADAVPVFGKPVTLAQPGGAEFRALLYGDEFGYYIESPDGHTLFQDDEGSWCYAEKSGSELASSGISYPSAGSKEQASLLNCARILRGKGCKRAGRNDRMPLLG